MSDLADEYYYHPEKHRLEERYEVLHAEFVKVCDDSVEATILKQLAGWTSDNDLQVIVFGRGTLRAFFDWKSRKDDLHQIYIAIERARLGRKGTEKGARNRLARADDLLLRGTSLWFYASRPVIWIVERLGSTWAAATSQYTPRRELFWATIVAIGLGVGVSWLLFWMFSEMRSGMYVGIGVATVVGSFSALMAGFRHLRTGGK